MAGPYRVLGLPVWIPLLYLAAVIFGLPLAGELIPGADRVIREIGDPFIAAGDRVKQSPLFLRIVYVVLLPGILAVGALPDALLQSAWFRPVGVVSIYVISYMAWVTLWVRTGVFIGVWDPFTSAYSQGRRFILRGWIRLTEFLEIGGRFGKAATGGFAGLIEVLSNRWLPGDIFLGRPKFGFGGLMRPIGLPTEKHMVTIAGTGSGKSTAALIPNLLLHEGSCLVIDPKGEIAAVTALRRGPGVQYGLKGMGQSVMVVDPFETVSAPGQSACYNVFDEMARVGEQDPDRPISYAGKIAEALVKPLSERDQYWDTAAQTFLRGLILYIHVHEPKDRRHLVRLRQLIMEGDVEGHKDAVARKVIDADDLSPMDVLLEKMRQARDGPFGEAIAGSAGSVVMMGSNQKSGVLTTIQEHTTFLDTPEIQRTCRTSDFLLEELKTQRLSVYVCLPLNNLTGKEARWLRLFVLLMLDMMKRVEKAPNPPVLLAIDEFPALGKLEGIVSGAATLRSYGVRLWIISQDMGQIEEAYGQRAASSLIASAEAVQVMGIKHAGTVDFLVGRLGRHMFTTGSGQQKRVQERNVLDADQVSRLLAPERKNQIIWRGDHRPLLLKLCPYYEYFPAWYYDIDERHKEKWNRRIWRSDETITLPVKPPPSAPPPYVPPKPQDRPWENYVPPPPDYRAASRPSKPEPMMIEVYDDPPAPPEQSWSRKVIDRTTIDPPPAPDYSEAMDELTAMVGLESVKTQVDDIAALMESDRKRAAQGLKREAISLHMIFSGNPGTGKTTVAEIVGRIYKDLGVLKKGHFIRATRVDLVGGYIGQSAIKTQEVVEKALDGVLFIDEVYSLVPPDAEKDFGYEVIATVVEMMERYRDRLAVVVAGYGGAEMERFLGSNPGLRSRFKTVIDFPDYSSPELTRIVQLQCDKVGNRLAPAAYQKLCALMDKVKDRAGKGFGNGRVARNVYDEMVRRKARRTRGKERADLTLFQPGDVPSLEDIEGMINAKE